MKNIYVSLIYYKIPSNYRYDQNSFFLGGGILFLLFDSLDRLNDFRIFDLFFKYRRYFTNHATYPWSYLVCHWLSLFCPWLSQVSPRMSLISPILPCFVWSVLGLSFYSLVWVQKKCFACFWFILSPVLSEINWQSQ